MSAPADTAAAPDAEATARRVEEVLDRLARRGDAESAAAAEELVHVLMDFYGAGLARILRLLDRGTDRAGDDGPHAALLGDELVASLLLLHDLHPEDTTARVGRALESVRRQHPMEMTGFDEKTGVLRLTPAGSGGCGCPSTARAAQQAVESALSCFAPEVTSVRLETTPAHTEPALLQISRRPPTAATSS